MSPSAPIGHSFKHFIQLQRLSKAVEEYDDDPAVWETVHTVRCDFRALRGTEQLEAQKINSNVTHKITIRHKPDVNSQWRILKDDGSGRIFNIESAINVDERSEFLEIQAVEQT